MRLSELLNRTPRETLQVFVATFSIIFLVLLVHLLVLVLVVYLGLAILVLLETTLTEMEPVRSCVELSVLQKTTEEEEATFPLVAASLPFSFSSTSFFSFSS